MERKSPTIIINHCRKTSGKNYADGVSSIKDTVFPYPDNEVEGCVEETGVDRSKSSLANDIGVLQQRLHEATAQLVQANSDCVNQGKKLESLERDREEATSKMMKVEKNNAAMKRKLASLEHKAKLPRPGPSLKAFEDLTPRQQKAASKALQEQVIDTSEERMIHPAKLSAYLTYRYNSGISLI